MTAPNILLLRTDQYRYDATVREELADWLNLTSTLMVASGCDGLVATEMRARPRLTRL